jgi:hypothetical protein
VDDKKDNHCQKQQEKQNRPQNPALSIPGDGRRQLVICTNVLSIRFVFDFGHAGLRAQAQLLLRSSQNRWNLGDCMFHFAHSRKLRGPEMITSSRRLRRFATSLYALSVPQTGRSHL